ncbi:hypothetical protein PV327_001936 [Microctonus hyperodae]|uniref:Uncharacterized protein n=1 Tax=Microctonus hyperodae TaxID=165561 RepID=A0AA39FEP4_MICHY|nr:hypothetical protein PV327_001936 [Microctonus hyperodae]
MRNTLQNGGAHYFGHIKISQSRKDYCSEKVETLYHQKRFGFEFFQKTSVKFLCTKGNLCNNVSNSAKGR